MLVPLQAHTNVRDVLAPLFCNGRSFANLIDELSRHFKFDSNSSQSHDDDADDDCFSESQSTDSEAEVCTYVLDLYVYIMYVCMHAM